jgi:hypothetical protein
LTPCDNDEVCSAYATTQGLNKACQDAVCNKQTGSCVIIQKQNAQCDIAKCQSTCVATTPCTSAVCALDVSGQYTCKVTANKCDDGKTCTLDYCEPTTGACVNQLIASATCDKLCDADVDCQAWGKSKFITNCQAAVCDTKAGACKVVSLSSANCPGQCTVSSDCADSQFGTVCSNGKCTPHQCNYDLDCLNRGVPAGYWGYCTVSDTGAKTCVPKLKCTTDACCDDNNPCTKDKVNVKYGFCSHTPACNDNNLCTDDICIPSADKTSYTCRNPQKSCTTDINLLTQDFATLSASDKQKWLGQCNPKIGCTGCIVNSQCDDNKGCTVDSCVQQYCVNALINNIWCDPKRDSQPITVEALASLRTQLSLAGYSYSNIPGLGQ